MKTVILYGLFIFLMACSSATRKKEDAESKLKDGRNRVEYANLYTKDADIWSKFFGDWCNSPDIDEDGYYLGFGEQERILNVIYFASSNKTYFYDLVGELIDNQQVRLYLNEFGGTESASKARELSDYEMDLQPAIECTLHNNRVLLLNILNDPKGVMPPSKTVELIYAEDYFQCQHEVGPLDYLDLADDIVRFHKYSKEYIEYLIGKSEPENVGDLFLLLSERLLFVWDYEERKQILSEKRIEQKEWKVTLLLEEFDLNENRLKVSQNYESEMNGMDYSWDVLANKYEESWQIEVVITERMSSHQSIYDIFYKNGTFIIENKIETYETQN